MMATVERRVAHPDALGPARHPQPHLKPTYTALVDVRTAPVVGTDETTWQLMEAGRSKTWCVWTPTRPDAVVYRLRGSRSAATATEVLGTYAGVVMCEGLRRTGSWPSATRRTAPVRRSRSSTAGLVGLRRNLVNSSQWEPARPWARTTSYAKQGSWCEGGRRSPARVVLAANRRLELLDPARPQSGMVRRER
jgi:hypothetical protein